MAEDKAVDQKLAGLCGSPDLWIGLILAWHQAMNWGAAQYVASRIFKMPHITEPMNISHATFVKSTQSSATTEQTWHY